MKRSLLTVFFLFIILWTGKAFAVEGQDVLDVAEKIVEEEKVRFGIDTKKCRLECGRVYSAEHCVAKCRDLANKQRDEVYEREEAEKRGAEEEKPFLYKEVAAKYR